MKKLGFGFMRLPTLAENDPTSIDMDQARRMVDLFMQRGFTYFDTAYPYHLGASERALGELLVARYPRESFTIADKLPMYDLPPAEKLEPIFQEQLERLGVDYFDYYLLHNLHGEAYDNAVDTGAFELVARKKREGKIRHIGFSIHDDAQQIERILTEHPEMEFVQIQLNYVDWENQGIQARKCYEVCRKYHRPVFVMEPVKGGTLCNLPEEAAAILRRANPEASLASWAIRFAADLPGVQVVLSGMSTLAQVEENTAFMDDFKPLTPAERAAVGQVVDLINASIAVPCSGCGYCLKDCPQGIPIPTYFALYNAHQQDTKGGYRSQVDYYGGLASRANPAGACVKCGKCEAVCPQHLKIRDHLAEVSRAFDA
ncbi:MAG: aldo/keto reductase [Christensenellales bacterium]|jgi:predicted aldo/keto reductase-like oxidoreductase